MKFLVLDIEAVVDPTLWTPPDDDPTQFAPPYAWRPICIGLALLEGDGKGIVTRRIGAIEIVLGDEHHLLVKFAELIVRLERPTVVTWNGRGYDLPVLMLRSLRHGIAHPWYYQQRDVRYRFSEEGHCDLKDAMSDHGASTRLDLDGMGKLIGCPGKFGDVQGANVGEAYAAGRIEEIVSYCIGDAVTTAFLFLRWQLLKGAMGHDAYRAAAATLLFQCEHEPRLKEWCARVDQKVLLLEGT
jgi:predicted PolB exonuclease-like 3'-5' exonuclease